MLQVVDNVNIYGFEMAVNFVICRMNYVILSIIIPVTVFAALAVIGGTIATVLAESIHSKAIFDKIVDVTPYLNHTFVINNVVINITSYKSTIQ